MVVRDLEGLVAVVEWCVSEVAIAADVVGAADEADGWSAKSGREADW